ncbi:hypothetical protein B0H13DRAFT_2008027 [Mycena leptocephala]|nr:hypothetical protein B0H13DRAFT_2008027 [Mycena leptocephala]
MAGNLRGALQSPPLIFPIELVHCVLQHVACDTDDSAWMLRACSLVCWDWLCLSRQILYKSIKLDGERDIQRFSARTASLLNTYRKFVSSIHVKNDDDRVLRHLFSRLSTFQRLKSLALSAKFLKIRDYSLLAGIISLDVTGSNFRLFSVFCDLLRAFPALKSLKIEAMLQAIHPGEESAASVPRLDLDVLSIKITQNSPWAIWLSSDTAPVARVLDLRSHTRAEKISRVTAERLSRYLRFLNVRLETLMLAEPIYADLEGVDFSTNTGLRCLHVSNTMKLKSQVVSPLPRPSWKTIISLSFVNLLDHLAAGNARLEALTLEVAINPRTPYATQFIGGNAAISALVDVLQRPAFAGIQRLEFHAEWSKWTDSVEAFRALVVDTLPELLAQVADLL